MYPPEVDLPRSDAEERAGDREAAAALHKRAAQSAAACGDSGSARVSQRRQDEKTLGRSTQGFYRNRFVPLSPFDLDRDQC
jgi:hypothetical protein